MIVVSETAMTELTGNAALSGPAEPEESVTEAVKDETSLSEAFESTLGISQDDNLTEPAASEEPEQEDGQQDAQGDGQQDAQGDGQQDAQGDGQQDAQGDRQQDGEKDRQQDGQTVSPPAAESSSTESKWAVGAQCRAVWSEDGRLYQATVVSLEGERCRVRFNGYGNHQDVELSALKRPEAVVQTQTQNSQEWKPGSRCRAVYSEDSLVYPAVVLWVKGQRCRIRFDDYNNEEEQDVSALLNPDELHGPSRVCAAKGSNRKSSVSSSNLEWKRRREENQQGERGGGGGERRDEEHNSSWVKEKLGKVEKESEEKKRGDGAEKPTNHSFSFFPPFPPPPQTSSGGPLSFVPPPPPLWTFAERDSGGSAAVDASSSMLMLWYMCGFHTGSFMAQQLQSSSKD